MAGVRQFSKGLFGFWGRRAWWGLKCPPLEEGREVVLDGPSSLWAEGWTASSPDPGHVGHIS